MDDSLRSLIISTYQDTVRDAACDSELKESLRTQERVPMFLANLQREISLVPKIERSDVISLTQSMTLTFLQAVQRKAHEAMMSDAEKSRLVTQQQDAAVIDKATNGDTITLTEEVLDVLNKG